MGKRFARWTMSKPIPAFLSGNLLKDSYSSRGVCGVCIVRRALTLQPRAGHASETCLCLDWGSSGQLFITAAVFSRAEDISQGLNFLVRERTKIFPQEEEENLPKLI